MSDKIPKPADTMSQSAFTAAEAWHLLGIMSEFADATERETLLNLQAEAAGRVTHQRQFC